MVKKKYKQAAAFCFKTKNGKKNILIVTARRTRQWILPKGWLEKDMSEEDLAALEAHEEAGVVTHPDKIKKLGSYRYKKRVSNKKTVPVNVNVYSMPIHRLSRKFKEKYQRKRKWVTIKKAIKMVSEKNLEKFLRKVI